MADNPTPTPEELIEKHSKLESELKKAQTIAAEKEKRAQELEQERDSMAKEFAELKKQISPPPTPKTKKEKLGVITKFLKELEEEFYANDSASSKGN